MASSRIDRINEELLRRMSVLVSELKDPRVRGTMVTVTRVEATGDLRYAKVYVSVMDAERAKDVLKGLRSASGFLRTRVAEAVNLRYTPELIFELDRSLARGAHVLDLIERSNIPKRAGDENDENA